MALLAVLAAGAGATHLPAQSTGPGPRMAHAAAYHAELGMVVVFGGRDADGTHVNDLWGWDGARWHALVVGANGPPARSRHAMAYDPGRRRLVVHGGGTREQDFGDTWAWAEGGWTRLADGGPGPRSHHHMAHDPASGSVLLYGGGRGADGFGRDVWTLRGDEWTPTGEALAPGRILAGMTGADHRVLLFGGLVRGGARAAELWEWRGGRWRLIEEGGPPGRIYPGVAWRDSDRELFLFGGEGEAGLLGDAWFWRASGWAPVDADPSPAARTEHAVAYDEARDVVVVFGGRTELGPTEDVWEWDGAEWRLVQPATDGQEPPGPQVTENEIGAPHFFAVRVEDVARSAAWYRRVFGLRDLGGSSADDGSWEIVNLVNERLWVEVVRDDRARPADRPRGVFKVGFFVPDVRAVADRVEATGGERPRVLDFAEFGVRIIQIRDPDGNLIQLFSRLDDGL